MVFANCLGRENWIGSGRKSRMQMHALSARVQKPRRLAINRGLTAGGCS